jgi:hypothetical protein
MGCYKDGHDEAHGYNVPSKCQLDPKGEHLEGAFDLYLCMFITPIHCLVRAMMERVMVRSTTDAKGNYSKSITIVMAIYLHSRTI